MNFCSFNRGPELWGTFEGRGSSPSGDPSGALSWHRGSSASDTGDSASGLREGNSRSEVENCVGNDCGGCAGGIGKCVGGTGKADSDRTEPVLGSTKGGLGGSRVSRDGTAGSETGGEYVMALSC